MSPSSGLCVVGHAPPAPREESVGLCLTGGRVDSCVDRSWTQEVLTSHSGTPQLSHEGPGPASTSSPSSAYSTGSRVDADHVFQTKSWCGNRIGYLKLRKPRKP